jgi:hypothetical protein
LIREDLGLTQLNSRALRMSVNGDRAARGGQITIDTINRVARHADVDLQIGLHPTAGERIMDYARQLHRLPPGPERRKVIESMRDHLTGRTSRLLALERRSAGEPPRRRARATAAEAQSETSLQDVGERM